MAKTRTATDLKKNCICRTKSRRSTVEYPQIYERVDAFSLRKEDSDGQKAMNATNLRFIIMLSI